MREDREARIRQRAHAIWEAEGRPQGREFDHWIRAEAEDCADGKESARLANKSARGKPTGRKRTKS